MTASCGIRTLTSKDQTCLVLKPERGIREMIGWKRATCSIFLICAVLAGPACQERSGSQDSGSPKSLGKVRLATSKNAWCALSLIALSKGFFAREGLEVEPQYLQSGRYCLDALVSNSAEFANIVEVNVAYFGYTGNSTVSVVGTVVSSTSSAIVARKSSGITVPADIKGKRLALSPGTTSDVFAHRFMDKHGLTASNVQLVKIQPLAMQGTMSGRGADAASTWQPYVSSIGRVLGDDFVVFKDPDIYVGYELLAVQKTWAAQNDAIIKAFLRANRAAAAFIRDNPAESQRILATELNIDLPLVQEMWSEFTFSLSLDKTVMVHSVATIGEWIGQDQQEYKGQPLPDYQTFFDDSFMQSIGKGN
jgi:NitT/TauT family transport system substrate-binding protein